MPKRQMEAISMQLTGLAVGTRLIGSVLAAAPPACRYAFAVQGAADDVVTDTRQVFYTAAPDQNHRVLLEVMPFTADVGSDFNSVS
jgi:hypothetical protein